MVDGDLNASSPGTAPSATATVNRGSAGSAPDRPVCPVSRGLTCGGLGYAELACGPLTRLLRVGGMTMGLVLIAILAAVIVFVIFLEFFP